MLAYDQGRLHVRGIEHAYTNAIDDPATWPDAYRVPLAAAVDEAEITGVAPTVKGTGITSLFTFDEIDGPGGVWPTVWSGTHDVPYEQIPGVRRRRGRRRPPRLPAGSSPGAASSTAATT